MMNKKSSPQQNDQPSQPQKKLLKQRQRILKELEAAQEAQAEALERFHRAEVRLQKRTANLQRVAAQLMIIHQQLGEPAGSVPLAVSTPAGERVRTLEGSPIVESTAHTPAATSTSEEEKHTPPQQADDTSVAARRDDELPAAVQHAKGGVEIAQAPPTQEAGDTSLAAKQDDELPAAVPHAEGPAEAAQTPEIVTAPDEEFPIASQHAAQVSEAAGELSQPGERSDTVEARLIAPTGWGGADARATMPMPEAPMVSASEAAAVAESIEDELPAATQHTPETPQAAQAPAAVEEASQETLAVDQPMEETPADTSVPVTSADAPGEVASVDVQETEAVEARFIAPVSPAEAVELAREARAVAEAAEQAAREAADRASALAAHLEQIGSGRHLLQELRQLQAEAERTDAIAQEANRAAREAEARAADSRFIEHIPSAQEMNEPVEIVDSRFIEESATGSAEGIEEEEAFVEADSARMIAGVAAAAAAEAEAVAEASSARTREARRFAQQADQVLEDARTAIRSGVWSGEDAELYLQALEHEAARAHALLAEAEAAEEQARNAAMNAEAEAEVAEGMAFATNDQAETLLNEHVSTSSTPHQQAGDDESDTTVKIRTVNSDGE